jgi:NhaP-type Na+/H+ or K+/H+ antiporter
VSDIFTLVVPLTLLAMWKESVVEPVAMVTTFVVAFVIAAAVGTIGAYAWSLLLTRVRTLQNGICTTPAFVFFLYGLVELMGGSGPVAALAFGIVLGNASLLTPPVLRPHVDGEAQALTKNEREFFSEAVFLLRTFFFVYAGVCIRLDDNVLLLLGAGITAALFLVRVPVVAATVSRATSTRDAALMAAMIPKGLGAAVLATVPVQMGITGGDVMQTVVYSIILTSTVLTTVMVFLVDRTDVGRGYRAFYGACGFAAPTPGTPPDGEDGGG